MTTTNNTTHTTRSYLQAADILGALRCYAALTINGHTVRRVARGFIVDNSAARPFGRVRASVVVTGGF